MYGLWIDGAKFRQHSASIPQAINCKQGRARFCPKCLAVNIATSGRGVVNVAQAPPPAPLMWAVASHGSSALPVFCCSNVDRNRIGAACTTRTLQHSLVIVMRAARPQSTSSRRFIYIFFTALCVGRGHIFNFCCVFLTPPFSAVFIVACFVCFCRTTVTFIFIQNKVG